MTASQREATAAPTSFDDLQEALKFSLAKREPVFIPACRYTDERGWSLMNLLRGVMAPEGQLNHSLQLPGVIKAWHRHQRQTDFWICVCGQMRAGIFREDDGKCWAMALGVTLPGVCIIPPELWHGVSTIGGEPAGLLYYVTRHYDPAAPDEQRRPHDSVPGFSWR